MKRNSTEQFFILGMALHADRRVMEQRVRGVFAKKRSAGPVRVLALCLSLALLAAGFTTACLPERAEAPAAADLSPAGSALLPEPVPAAAAAAEGPTRAADGSAALPAPPEPAPALTQALVSEIAEAFFAGREARYLMYDQRLLRTAVQDNIDFLRREIAAYEAHLAAGGSAENWTEDAGTMAQYYEELPRQEALLEDAIADEDYENALLDTPLLYTETGETGSYALVETRAWSAGVYYALDAFSMQGADEWSFSILSQNEISYEGFLARRPGDGVAWMSALYGLNAGDAETAAAQAALDVTAAGRDALAFLETIGIEGAEILGTEPTYRIRGGGTAEESREYGWICTLARYQGETFKLGVYAAGPEYFSWETSARYSGARSEEAPFALTQKTALPAFEPDRAQFTQTDIEGVLAALFPAGAEPYPPAANEAVSVASRVERAIERNGSAYLEALYRDELYTLAVHEGDGLPEEGAVSPEAYGQIAIYPAARYPADAEDGAVPGAPGADRPMADLHWGVLHDREGGLLERVRQGFPPAEAAGIANAFLTELAARTDIIDLAAYRLVGCVPSYRFPDETRMDSPEYCWLLSYASMQSENLELAVTPAGVAALDWNYIGSWYERFVA
ncbi:MAG: hypothetical protein Q4C13_05905 [Clostridia bacterium]|nr:hypothetical protein [Clostridia bacterium]